jgi:hypothetical protein
MGSLVVQKQTFDIKDCDKQGRRSNEMTPCTVDNEKKIKKDKKKNTLVGGCVLPLQGNNETSH